MNTQYVPTPSYTIVTGSTQANSEETMIKFLRTVKYQTFPPGMFQVSEH